MRFPPSNPGRPDRPAHRRLIIHVDGRPVEAMEGQTVASALLAAGIRTLHLSSKSREPRGLYCGMGVCYECLVTVDGAHAVRACLTLVADGMQVETCRGLEL